jgi:hypothetical protein
VTDARDREGSAIETDIHAEADRLAGLAVESGLALRLMGGLAIWLTSPTVRRPPYRRSYGDLDFAASSHERPRVDDFFEAAGYRAEKLFNALHGASRLNYVHPLGHWPIDVILDELRMSHRIDLRGRLSRPGPTISLADLLLTKLQIWQINDKDVGDAVCLLADHAIDDGSETAIDSGRIVALLRVDWGLCHTVERNLHRVAELAREQPPDGGACDAALQAEALLELVAAAPKSLAWRARAGVGERVAWYQVPEEVRHQT